MLNTETEVTEMNVHTMDVSPYLVSFESSTWELFLLERRLYHRYQLQSIWIFGLFRTKCELPLPERRPYYCGSLSMVSFESTVRRLYYWGIHKERFDCD